MDFYRYRKDRKLSVFLSAISVGILSGIFATVLYFIGVNRYLIIPLSVGLGLGVFFWFNRKVFFQKII